MSRKIVILLILIVLIISAVAYAYYEYNRPAGTIGSVDFTMEASKLLSEFEQDEATANKKYLDKVIEVKGPVKDIMQQEVEVKDGDGSRMENGVTVLLGDKDGMSSVSCALGKEGSDAATIIKVGDTVSIKGMCTGILLDVALVNCELINN